jgi:hypothetical protein
MNLRGLRLLIWWRASVVVLLNTVLYSIKMQPVPVYSISLLGPLALPYCIKLVLYFPRHFLYSIPKYLCTQFRRSPLSRFTIVLDFFIRSTVQYSAVQYSTRTPPDRGRSASRNLSRVARLTASIWTTLDRLLQKGTSSCGPPG